MEQQYYLKAPQVAIVCNVGLSQAYKIINAANDKLAKQGKYVVKHRIPRKFLFEFLGIE